MAKSRRAPTRNRQSSAFPAGRAGKPDRSRKKTRGTRTSTASAAGAAPRKARGASARPKRRQTERVTGEVLARADRREETVRTPPSSLDMDRRPSAARSGRRELLERFAEHHGTGPVVAGGDLDADWQGAATVGDEAAGGDNPTPDQQIVDDIGRAIGVEYQDAEELRGTDKIAGRDKRRWELDPASSEDYGERAKERKRGRSR